MPDLMGKNNTSEEQDALPLERGKAEEQLKKLKDWGFSPDGKKIFRNLAFNNFREAIDFINGVADFAEKIDHYPDVMVIRFQKVTIELTTRHIKGLSEKDFILAAEIDAIAGWKKKLERWINSPRVLVPLAIILLLIILWQRLS
jgi:4a-hydroxytetrahydrobiopterin dehydratase